MPQEAAVVAQAPAPRNAAEAVQQLTQHAQSLVKHLQQLLSSHQQSSSGQAASTTGHIAIYDEAVHLLEVIVCLADHSSGVQLVA